MCLGTRRQAQSVKMFFNHSHAFSKAHRREPLPESTILNFSFRISALGIRQNIFIVNKNKFSLFALCLCLVPKTQNSEFSTHNSNKSIY
jgi:hypothetical protein